VFGSRKWTRIALSLNVLGALLLFLSFQATSSSFRLIKRPIPSAVFQKPEYSYEICVEDFTLLSTYKQGVAFGHEGCPAATDDRPAAVVNTEHPVFVTIGFLLILFGFIVQYFSVPEGRSISDLREEIKLLKRQQRDSRLNHPSE
jgi:hypothetical protein